MGVSVSGCAPILKKERERERDQELLNMTMFLCPKFRVQSGSDLHTYQAEVLGLQNMIDQCYRKTRA